MESKVTLPGYAPCNSPLSSKWSIESTLSNALSKTLAIPRSNAEVQLFTSSTGTSRIRVRLTLSAHVGDALSDTPYLEIMLQLGNNVSFASLDSIQRKLNRMALEMVGFTLPSSNTDYQRQEDLGIGYVSSPSSAQQMSRTLASGHLDGLPVDNAISPGLPISIGPSHPLSGAYSSTLYGGRVVSIATEQCLPRSLSPQTSTPPPSYPTGRDED